MKKILGLILELNPFHNGHQYFIKEAIKKVEPDYVIAVVSGSFTMRGEVSIIDKFTKAKLLLENGVDLVMELPFISTVVSADYFAYNALKILTDLRITGLAFGVELDNLNKLNRMKDVINSNLFQNTIKNELSKGRSYSAASLYSLKLITDDNELISNFSLPNNTLGIQYLRAKDELNSSLNISLIKRISNNFYDIKLSGKLSSATSIRNLLNKNEDISEYVPSSIDEINYIKPDDANERILFILKYLFSIKDANYFSNILGVNEGIENRINNFLDKSSTYDELIKNISTRRYSTNTIARMILHILMDTKDNYQNKYLSYLRMLSANNKGLAYINTLPKEVKKTIITSFKNIDDKLVLMDLSASKLYGLLTNNNKFYLNEFLVPFIKDK